MKFHNQIKRLPCLQPVTVLVFLFFGGLPFISVAQQDALLPDLYEFSIENIDSVRPERVTTTGTRSNGRIVTEAAVAVDIITAEDLRSTGNIELSQALSFLLPYFNANHQSISDGTDHIDPASIHGMGPDQMLVFINGKRYHPSALVNVNGTFGRGCVNVDFNTIPISAIHHIEILKESASAQYGSDAIAGVVNIILKENTGTEIMGFAGSTVSRDGLQRGVDFTMTNNIGTQGTLLITASLVDRNGTDRSGDYTGTIYHQDATTDYADPRTAAFDRHIMKIGNADATYSMLFFNYNQPLGGKDNKFYAFGGISYHQGHSYGYFRFPKEDLKVVTELYPDGFLPELNIPILDHSFTLGTQRRYNGWLLDMSNTYGNTSMHFFAENTNNASMGIQSPLSFYAGGFKNMQNTLNIDVSRKLDMERIEGINMAFGGEFRLDNFAILQGEQASYFNGGATNIDGYARQPGAQVFYGFQENNQLKRDRFSLSGYTDLEFDISENFYFNLAAHYVEYSDFGKKVSTKLACRYKLTDQLFLRGTAGNGFRAPSPQQAYATSISTQIIDQQSYLVGTFNNPSEVAKAFGIPKLKEETSRNFNLGFVLLPLDGLEIQATYFNIDVKDRIVLSGRFSNGDDQKTTAIFENFGLNSAQFFTNAVSTNTQGVDFGLDYNYKLAKKHEFKFSAMACFAHNKVKRINPGIELQGKDEIVFNREERSRLEWGVPREKAVLRLNYKHGLLHANISQLYFGQVKYVDPINPELDQTFSPKWLTNAEMGINLYKSVIFSIGGHNILNVYPDKHTNPANTNNGCLVYSRRVKQFSYDGAFFYFKITVGI